MKTKNPLYVVKGKTVHEASGLWDMVLKKFNLEPVVSVLMNIMHLILKHVSNYPSFIAAKKLIDDLMGKIQTLKASAFGSRSSV